MDQAHGTENLHLIENEIFSSNAVRNRIPAIKTRGETERKRAPTPFALLPLITEVGKRMGLHLLGKLFGGPARTRTEDQGIMSPLL